MKVISIKFCKLLLKLIHWTQDLQIKKFFNMILPGSAKIHKIKTFKSKINSFLLYWWNLYKIWVIFYAHNNARKLSCHGTKKNNIRIWCSHHLIKAVRLLIKGLLNLFQFRKVLNLIQKINLIWIIKIEAISGHLYNNIELKIMTIKFWTN